MSDRLLERMLPKRFVYGIPSIRSNDPKMPINWTKETNDPVHGPTRAKVLNYLLSVRSELPYLSQWAYEDYLADESKSKRVLDIGICEHTQERMRSERWKHRVLKKSASYCLGIDILEYLVKKLNDEGFNVRSVDATSDIDLGERFDLVHIGDVIEHVNDPVRLLKFAERHLVPGGKVIVRTPNPFHYSYVWQVAKRGTDLSNLEHVAWVTPTMALEIGRRSGMDLTKYYVLSRKGSNFIKTAIKKLMPLELWTTIYVYEYIKPAKTQ